MRSFTALTASLRKFLALSKSQAASKTKGGRPRPPEQAGRQAYARRPGRKSKIYGKNFS